APISEATVVVDEDVREVVEIENLLEVRPPGRGQGRQVPVTSLDPEPLAGSPGDALDLGQNAGSLAFVDEPPPARPDEAEVNGSRQLESLRWPRVDPPTEGSDLEDLEVRVGDADDPARIHGDAFARDRVVLEDQDPHTAPRQEERDREAVDPRADDDDVPRAGRDPSVAPLEDLTFSHRVLAVTGAPGSLRRSR